jgi:biopolymer transport protein ExbB
MDLLFILILVVTSIIAVAMLIERGLALRWEKVIPPQVVTAVQSYNSSRDLARMQAICDHHPSPISRLLLFTMDHLDWPKNETVEVLQTRAKHEVTKLERGLVVLEIIVGIAPLMGLVGTIYGLILLFGSMDMAAASGTSDFSRGISLALRATLLGLCVAIPALIGWSYYSRKVETLSVEMESLCDEFLRKHYRMDETMSGAEQEQVTRLKTH